MRAAAKAAYDEREQRRAAAKAAFEEREKRRSSVKAAIEEGQKPWAADKADVCSNYSSTASTTATRAEEAPRVCSFCGATCTEVKRKPGQNVFHGRCQTCFRKLDK